MTDKELEEKLRWIFETYGKDLQAFFRDAYADLTNFPQCETIHNVRVSKVLARHSNDNPVRTSKRKQF